MQVLAVAALNASLMFMLGSDFDTDPQLPWAAQILTDQASPNQMSRADRLYEKSGEYVAKVAGPDYEYAKQALRRAKQVQLQGLSLSAAAFETELLAHLRSNHPEKCHYIGEPALRSLIPLGVELAKRHSIATSAGLILLTGLAFALGHGFSTDLQFPWISSTLGNDRIDDPNKRVERLYSKTMTYLDHVLAYHER